MYTDHTNNNDENKDTHACGGKDEEKTSGKYYDRITNYLIHSSFVFHYCGYSAFPPQISNEMGLKSTNFHKYTTFKTQFNEMNNISYTLRE